MEDIAEKVSKALAPLSVYMDELYGFREEICIVKEFLDERYLKEKNPETKVVLSLAIRRLREQISKLDRIRDDLFPDVQEAAMKFALLLVQDALEEIRKIQTNGEI